MLATRSIAIRLESVASGTRGLTRIAALAQAVLLLAIHCDRPLDGQLQFDGQGLGMHEADLTTIESAQALLDTTPIHRWLGFLASAGTTL